jgi:molybdenum cofactor cytidylyltransferase
MPSSRDPEKTGRRIAGIVLAAGLSRRLGRPKQLLTAKGRLLPAYVLENVLESGLDPLLLVLGHRAGEVEGGLLADPVVGERLQNRIRLIHNPGTNPDRPRPFAPAWTPLKRGRSGALFIMADQRG